MQLSAIRTAVNQQVGINLSAVAVTALINQALRQIAGERDWPWLALVETGTWPAAETTTLDVTAKAVRSVNVGGLRYDPMPEQDADLDWSDRVIKGYSVADRELRVVPTPPEGTAYTVWYVAEEEVLSGDSDEPLIPDRHINAVILLACSFAHDRPEGSKDARERFEYRYLGELARMCRTAEPKRGAQLVRVRQDTI